MEILETRPKQWGNSLGITIPREIVKREGITPNETIRVIIVGKGMEKVRKTFGTLTFKKSTQQMMDEIDEGYD